MTMGNKHLGTRPKLRIAFAGLAAAVVGAGLGAYLGNEAPFSGGNVSAAIWAVIGGSWVGAILFGGLTVWLGLKVSR
jgi:hypothetical protein